MFLQGTVSPGFTERKWTSEQFWTRQNRSQAEWSCNFTFVHNTTDCLSGDFAWRQPKQDHLTQLPNELASCFEAECCMSVRSVESKHPCRFSARVVEHSISGSMQHWPVKALHFKTPEVKSTLRIVMSSNENSLLICTMRKILSPI